MVRTGHLFQWGTRRMARAWHVTGRYRTALGVPGAGAVEVHCTALGVPARCGHRRVGAGPPPPPS